MKSKKETKKPVITTKKKTVKAKQTPIIHKQQVKKALVKQTIEPQQKLEEKLPSLVVGSNKQLIYSVAEVMKYINACQWPCPVSVNIRNGIFEINSTIDNLDLDFRIKMVDAQTKLARQFPDYTFNFSSVNIIKQKTPLKSALSLSVTKCIELLSGIMPVTEESVAQALKNSFTSEILGMAHKLHLVPISTPDISKVLLHAQTCIEEDAFPMGAVSEQEKECAPSRDLVGLVGNNISDFKKSLERARAKIEDAPVGPSSLSPMDILENLKK